MTYVEPVAYATPAPRSGSRVWAGAMIVLAGLLLVLLGGCFLIGVMLTVSSGFTMGATPALSAAERVLVSVLYLLAFASFAGAVWLLIIGVRGLLHVLRE